MNDKLLRESTNRLRDMGFEVAPRPDHPLLAAPPDLIASNPDCLYAVFGLNTRESYDQLLARLAVARLALPMHTHCILIENPPPYRNLPVDLADFHFDHVLPFGSDISSLDIRDNVPDRIRSHSRSIEQAKAMAFRRFVVLVEESSPNFEEDSHLTDMPTDDFLREQFNCRDAAVYSWSRGNHPVTSSAGGVHLLQNDSLVFARKEFSNSSNRTKDLRALCATASLLSYSLDRGIPFPQQQMPTNVLIVDSMIANRFDPEQPYRTAAFAGWAVLRTDDIDVIKAKTQRLHRRLAQVQS